MNEILADLNTAAMVLGYIFLVLILAAILYFASFFLANWKYKMNRKRRQDKEWDNIRSKWLLEGPIEPRRKVDHEPYNRIDTDVLDVTVDQIYDYQKEQYRDAS